MKLLLMILLLTTLSACNKTEDKDTSYKEAKSANVRWSYSKVCIEGVTYIRAGHEFSVMFNTDSRIIPCNDETYK